MSSVLNFIPQEVITSLGWTLFHSLWQGCVVTLLLLVALYSIKSKDSKLKTLLSTSALFLILIAAIVSFSFEYKSATKPVIITTSLFENPVSQESLNAIANAAKNTDKNIVTVVLTKMQQYFTESIPLIVTIWSIGFAFFFIRFFGGVIGTAKLRKSITLIEDKNWILKLEHLRKKINLNKRVGLAESALTKVPLVLGYFKPVVLFPVGLLTGLPQGQIEAIIAHEIAHIKRYDVLINFIQSFVEVIFFYNPFVWFISHRIRIERENCCDDIAINLCGDSVTYAKALANVESFKESNEPLFAIPLFKNQNQLLRRIKRMIQKDQNQNGFKEKFAAAIIFIGILVVAVVVKSVNPVASVNDTQLNKAGMFSSSIFVGDKELTNIEIDTVKSVKGKKSFSYLQKENGKTKRFKAKMKNGVLTDLSIDGEKVPEEKLNSYKDDVEEAFKKVEDDDYFSHRRGGIHISGDFFDSESFSADMEKIGEDIEKSFNSQEFKENMKEFSEQMEQFGKEFSRQFAKGFDTKEYKREMNKLRREIKDHEDDEDFDSEEYEDQMDRLERKMDHMDLNINLDGLRNLKNLKGLEHLKNLNIDMSGFEKGMKGFKEKMKVFGEKMKVFGKFMKEVKELLVDEKIISDIDDDIDLNIKKTGIYVNDEKQSDAVFQKVKKLYKKYYDKEFDGSFHIGIDED